LAKLLPPSAVLIPLILGGCVVSDASYQETMTQIRTTSDQSLPAPPGPQTASEQSVQPLPFSGSAGLETIDGRRLALVIGNSAYKQVPALTNPANDARLIARTLRSLGFEVAEVLDADQATMKRAIQAFGVKLENYGTRGIGLFFYAGHGVQAGGKNYLIPVAAHIERETDLEIEAVSADWAVQQMDFAKSKVNIVILDACRNNPFGGRGFRAVSRGLARMDAPSGTLLAYSTGPGDVASDGSGSNSPYSAALAKAMIESGIPLEQAFKQVRLSVREATRDVQTPWESSSLTGNFYFVPAASPQ